MSVLQVYLVPKVRNGPTFGEGTMYVTGLYLTEYLDKACKGTDFDHSDFHWEGSGSQVRDTDLVCYVLESSFNSIVANHGAQGDLGGGGSTGWSTRSHAMISEVYWGTVDGDANTGRLLANLIFHELMHNKLDAHPTDWLIQDVHKISGGRVSKVPVSSSSKPSAEDIEAMRKGLKQRVKQYTGGM